MKYCIMFFIKAILWYWLFAIISNTWNIMDWHHHLQIMYTLGFVLLAVMLKLLHLLKQLD